MMHLGVNFAQAMRLAAASGPILNLDGVTGVRHQESVK